MALRDYTKQLFANALMEMAETQPLHKIRISALCERCGAERQSFYYHFKDKYDLAAWIFMRDYEAALTEGGGPGCVNHAAVILRRMLENAAFYRKAFSDRSQNAVRDYVLDYFTQAGENTVRSRLGEAALDVEARYAIRSHSFACVGHTVEWLAGKTSYTPEEFARLQYRFMPLVLKRAYGISEEENE